MQGWRISDITSGYSLQLWYDPTADSLFIQSEWSHSFSQSSWFMIFFYISVTVSKNGNSDLYRIKLWSEFWYDMALAACSSNLMLSKCNLGSPSQTPLSCSCPRAWGQSVRGLGPPHSSCSRREPRKWRSICHMNWLRSCFFGFAAMGECAQRSVGQWTVKYWLAAGWLYFQETQLSAIN